MRNQAHFGTFLAVAILLVCPCAGAQGTPDSSAGSQQATQKPTAKPHKTWTDDDVSSLRTPADNYVREKEEQATAAAAKQAEEAQAVKQAAANTSAQKATPSPLSNPKSPSDADRMIAWEQRDLDSQQEAVEQTKQELAAATTPEERAQKQKALDHYIDCVERIKQEKQGLEKDRSSLQKKAKEKEQVESAGLQTDTP